MTKHITRRGLFGLPVFVGCAALGAVALPAVAERTVPRFPSLDMNRNVAFDLLELRFRTACELTDSAVDMWQEIPVSAVGKEPVR